MISLTCPSLTKLYQDETCDKWEEARSGAAAAVRGDVSLETGEKALAAVIDGQENLWQLLLGKFLTIFLSFHSSTHDLKGSMNSFIESSRVMPNLIH